MSIQIKRTWKEPQEWQKKIYETVKAEAKRLYPEYFENTKYTFKVAKSTKYVGRCVSIYNQDTLYNKQFGFKNHFGNIRNTEVVIILNENVKSEEIVTSTLVHEWGHAVTPTEHHSECWLNRANKIGEKFNVTCQRLATEEERRELPEKEPYKYKVYCPKCDAHWLYRKKIQIVQYPFLYQCRKCKEKLEMTKID